MQPTSTTKIKVDPYSSRTGAGTLSYYAKKYNTSVSELQKLNNIKDPNKIQSGGDLYVPNPIIQTTAGVTAKDAQNTSKLAEYNQKLNGTNTEIGTSSETDITKKEEGSGKGLDNKDIDSRYSDEENLINNTFNEKISLSNSATKALMESIKSKFAARIEQMKNTNARLLGSKEIIGNRSGRARYASLIQEGILTDEEQQGVARISEIQAQELQLLAEAQFAQSERDMDSLDKKMEALYKLQKDKQEELFNLNKLTLDQEKMALDKAREERQAKKDEIEISTKMSASIAPSVAENFSKLKNASEKKSFIEKMALAKGIDPEQLLSDVIVYMRQKGKEDLDMENVRSQINKRNKTEDGGIDKNGDGMDDETGDIIDDGSSSTTKTQSEFLTMSLSLAKKMQKLKLNPDTEVIKIQEALKQGFKIDDIAQYRGYSADLVKLIKKNITTNSKK